jgi:outer membrane receptor protein involved in Fe transport
MALLVDWTALTSASRHPTATCSTTSSWPLDSIGTGSKDGQNNETFGYELLFVAEASENVRFTVGANYFDETAFNGSNTCYNLFVNNGAVDPVTCQDTGLHFELVPDNPNGTFIDPNQDPGLWPNAPRINGGGPGPFGGEVSVWNKSTGIFGHVTWDISDRWTLDLGGRYTEDDREFHNFEFASTGCDVSLDPANMCAYTLPVDIVHVNDTGFFNQAADTFSEFTPMISVTRNLDSGNGMFYALYSEGFLTGGFNTEVNANLPVGGPDLSYNPEHVDNFEIGFKGQFMDGAVQLMTTVFFMDYTDQQKQIELPNPDGIFGTEDSGTAASSGSISDISRATSTSMNTRIRRTPARSSTGRSSLLTTLRHDFTPDMSINLSVEHEFQLGGGGTITPRLNWNWQDEYEWAAETGSWPKNAPPSGCHQDAYSTLDARVTYKPRATGRHRSSAAISQTSATSSSVKLTVMCGCGAWVDQPFGGLSSQRISAETKHSKLSKKNGAFSKAPFFLGVTVRRLIRLRFLTRSGA